MSPSKKVIVIGAGAIGLFSAWYLQKAGHQVTLLEKDNETDRQASSIGNAGLLAVSHVVPLAAPGAITKGLKMMLDKRGAFSIKPRFNKNLLKWLWLFKRSANEERIAEISPMRYQLSYQSKLLYKELAEQEQIDFGYREDGLLMVYSSEEERAAELEMAKAANEFGMPSEQFSYKQVQEKVPGISDITKGAVFFPEDANIDPGYLITGLTKLVQEVGVEVRFSTKVQSFKKVNRKITEVHTETDSYQTDEVVLAAGSWSQELANSLNLNLPVEAGKGYSFDIKTDKRPTCPFVIGDANICVTPMIGKVRVTGVMEISGIDLSINQNRVEGIKRSVAKYLPHLLESTPENIKVWSGLRPCSPDGLSYIGRSTKFNNLTIATGHATLGMTMAPASGKLVAEIISGERPSIDLELLSPDRV